VVTVGCVVANGGASHILQCRERMFVVSEFVFGCVSTPPWVEGEGSIGVSSRVPAFSACVTRPPSRGGVAADVDRQYWGGCSTDRCTTPVDEEPSTSTFCSGCED